MLLIYVFTRFIIFIKREKLFVVKSILTEELVFIYWKMVDVFDEQQANIP